MATLIPGTSASSPSLLQTARPPPCNTRMGGGGARPRERQSQGHLPSSVPAGLRDSIRLGEEDDCDCRGGANSGQPTLNPLPAPSPRAFNLWSLHSDTPPPTPAPFILSPGRPSSSARGGSRPGYSPSEPRPTPPPPHCWLCLRFWSLPFLILSVFFFSSPSGVVGEGCGEPRFIDRLQVQHSCGLCGSVRAPRITPKTHCGCLCVCVCLCVCLCAVCISVCLCAVRVCLVGLLVVWVCLCWCVSQWGVCVCLSLYSVFEVCMCVLLSFSPQGFEGHI